MAAEASFFLFWAAIPFGKIWNYIHNDETCEVSARRAASVIFIIIFFFFCERNQIISA